MTYLVVLAFLTMGSTHAVGGVETSPVAAVDTVIVAPDTVATPPARAPRRGAPVVEEIYGGGETFVESPTTYRVRLAPGAVLPVQYLWDFGEGTAAIGNTVTLAFPQPGEYRLRVVARNRLGADSAHVDVAVQPAPEPNGPMRVEPPAEPGPGYYWVVGSHQDLDHVREEVERLRGEGMPAVSMARRADRRFVAVGPYASEDDARSVRSRLEELAGTSMFMVDYRP